MGETRVSDNLFSGEEKERAKVILKQLEGLSIASAQSLLERCGMVLVRLTVDMGSLNF